LGGIILYWRVIDTDLNHPYFVTAADEVLALSCAELDGQNTLHFYRREPPAVSMGYFRNVSEDVDKAACENLGVKIVRRTSGGGSIYTDKDQLIFSLISKHSLGADVEDSFRNTCTGIVNALAKLGITANYKPPNDVQINGKKISGSAQIKKKNVYLTHSTIILDLDTKVLHQVLKQARADYTSSIRAECGDIPDIQKLKQAIMGAYAYLFDVEFQPGPFTAEESDIIQELIENKYSTDKWNFKR
jgi:lipoate-protein ligase A